MKSLLQRNLTGRFNSTDLNFNLFIHFSNSSWSWSGQSADEVSSIGDNSNPIKLNEIQKPNNELNATIWIWMWWIFLMGHPMKPDDFNMNDAAGMNWNWIGGQMIVLFFGGLHSAVYSVGVSTNVLLKRGNKKRRRRPFYIHTNTHTHCLILSFLCVADLLHWTFHPAESPRPPGGYMWCY